MKRHPGRQDIVPLDARLRSAQRRNGSKFKSSQAAFSLKTGAFPGPPQERCPAGPDTVS